MNYILYKLAMWYTLLFEKLKASPIEPTSNAEWQLMTRLMSCPPHFFAYASGDRSDVGEFEVNYTIDYPSTIYYIFGNYTKVATVIIVEPLPLTASSAYMSIRLTVDERTRVVKDYADYENLPNACKAILHRLAKVAEEQFIERNTKVEKQREKERAILDKITQSYLNSK